MASNSKKRLLDIDLNQGLNRKHRHHHSPSSSSITKKPSFQSYLETPNLPPTIKLLCEIIANTPSHNVESVLDATVIRVNQTDVEQVLKLSYSSPGSAVKFFRWAGLQLNDKHSPYSWNLVVDLLEGWEKEMNVASARTTFADMVSMVGWDPRNVPAYDTFLSTLLKGYDGLREAMKHFDIMKDRGCFPGVKFFRLALEECLKCNDIRAAMLIWETLVARVGFRPDIQLYNLMIAIHCYDNQTDIANKFLDEMIYNEVFPDSQTYNVLFQYLIKYKKLKEASFVLSEMIKNEFFPTKTNCNAAIKAYMDSKEPYMAIKVWKCMMENYGESDLEEAGNMLVVELRYHHMVPEAVKYAEVMIERGIKLTSSSLSKLKQMLNEEKKPILYEELLRKWKAHRFSCGFSFAMPAGFFLVYVTCGSLAI
ncbi:pentatricopeptide repeat-containing protein [Populus alba x Populus x berolinensis]|nr:pentatricopeptide repeat-containing protein [Populus alba x Populus x berolinensis]